jgi:hypothetical protein
MIPSAVEWSKTYILYHRQLDAFEIWTGHLGNDSSLNNSQKVIKALIFKEFTAQQAPLDLRLS